jgi:hypothetical protein
MSFDVRTRLSMLRGSARKRGINVNLDIAKYQYIIDRGCEFCGISLENEKGYCLDRVNNKKGYVITNVVGCCKICNRAKSDMDVYEFMDWVIRANKHINKNADEIGELKSLGFTEDMMIEMALRITDEYSKQMNFGRLKEVNSTNVG